MPGSRPWSSNQTNGLELVGPYIVREKGSRTADAMVSAAGPLVNLLLAATTWQDWHTFALANLVLGLSNLLPLPKCDGRRILRALSFAENRTRLRIDPTRDFPGASILPKAVNCTVPSNANSTVYI